MDRETMSKLRLDRRLTRRRNWISDEDLEREIDALPDVSHKIASGASDDAGPVGEAAVAGAGAGATRPETEWSPEA